MSNAELVYKYWPSKNRFFLKGRCVTGPKSDLPISLAPYIIFCLALAFYFYLILPGVVNYNIFLTVCFLASFTITIIFMLLASCTDPGFIPQRPFLQLKQTQIQKENHFDFQFLITEPQYLRIQYLLYESSDVHQVFCSTCHVYRPNHASHCSQCQSCILNLDHHCPWVNNCIGLNNYKYFIAFIGSLIATMITFMLNVLIYLQNWSDNGKSEHSDDSLTTYILIGSLLVGALMLILLGFFVFHLYLYCKGKTTRQLLKQRKNQANKQKKKSHNLNQREDTLKKENQEIEQKITQNQQLQRNLLIDQIQQESRTQRDQKYKNQPQNNQNKQYKPRFLDDYINWKCYEPATFYKQLFEKNNLCMLQSINLINFKQQLSKQDQKFIQKGFTNMNEKKQQMTKGKRSPYSKIVQSNHKIKWDNEIESDNTNQTSD